MAEIPNIKLKIDVETRDFEKKLAKVVKAIESLNKSKIIVNIEQRTITKRWWEFWK